MTLPVLHLVPDGRHHEMGLPVDRFRGQRIGDILVRIGALSSETLLRGLAVQPTEGRRIGEILTARGWVSEDALAMALALQAGALRADLAGAPADPRLVDRLGAARCLHLGLVPWKIAGAVTIVAAPHLAAFAAHRGAIERSLGPCRAAIATRSEIEAALLDLRRPVLTRHAEYRVPAAESCRSLPRLMAVSGLFILASLVAVAALMPTMTLAILCAWAIASLLLTSGLRIAAAAAQLAHVHLGKRTFATARDDPQDVALPTISLIVPLFREREIAEALVSRLGELDYPSEKLDICLVVEADDASTRRMLAGLRLPPEMRQVVVPNGTVRTKPRALNFALDFSRGSLIGIYDAEDHPARDQLRAVARAFRQHGPDVACLQGILDFYNTRTNWLSRCFAIDYATWFRVVLPGLRRLGFVIPLGGTTLFFRREALAAVGGWDAHNVTEDADLGVRLARHGYRTELLDSVTEEEANCRVLPWIRQRSRWLKGYLMTWASHMRSPRQLLADLGLWKFLGFQILFLGTLSNFILAPLLWSFWLIAFGVPHPATDLVSWPVVVALGSLFLLSEVLNLAVSAVAVTTARHRWLLPWVPTLHLYFPLGALASWKALAEIAVRPFYWDKTAHGISGRPRRVTRRR